ncbi:MAG TPA: AMP-binding protein, partial [Candidatus Acidoferrum sp.]|nr:AMP-binding protein [Candidatus Acidoferrum sp.]
MISYTHGASDVPLIGETIGELVDRIARQHGNHEAVVSTHQGVRMTYSQLAKTCSEVARGLLAMGVNHGDRVGIWSTNNVEWVIVQFATAKIGAILVNVNPAYRTVELEYVLRQSGISVLFSQDQYKSSNYLDMVEEVRDRLPELRSVIVIGGNARRDGDIGWAELRTLAETVAADHLAERQQATQFDEPINIQYTSGTTGFPKGATL